MDSVKNNLLQNDISRELLEKIDTHLSDIEKPRVLITSSNMTNTIISQGIHKLYEEKIDFIHTLGCPQSYVPISTIDSVIKLSESIDNIIVLKESSLLIKGSKESLNNLTDSNNNIIKVNREIDALELAINNKNKNIIFLSTGYELNSPSLAGLVLETQEKEVSNLYLFVCNKQLIPAVKNLLNKSHKISGYIAPGDLTILTGTKAWEFIPEEYKIPVVIGGFDRVSILYALEKLLEMIQKKDYSIKNNFSSLVNEQGNPLAQQKTYKVFTPRSDSWNGYGLIPFSGLGFLEEFQNFDASKHFQVSVKPEPDTRCKCEEVLGLKLSPQDCPAYNKECTPQKPLGTCMSLNSGLCSTFFHTDNLYIPDIKSFTSIIE